MTDKLEPIADTLRGACSRLSISRSSAYVQIKQGRLVALKVGGKTLITRAEQDRWLAALPVAGLVR